MSFKKPALLATAGALALSLGFLTAPCRAEPVEQAVVSALNHHPSVEAAIANRNAFSQEEKEQWAEHFPSLNVRGAGGRIFGDNSTSRGLQVSRDSTYSYLWEGSVTLTQELFDGFETFNRVDAANMRRESANYNIMDLRENLALKTVLSYLDVLRARETLAKMEAHRLKLADYQARITKMVDEGAADESMVVQARDIQAQFDSTLADVEGQLMAANVEYAELTGHLPDDPMQRPVPRAGLFSDEPAESVEYAMKNHPALKGAQSTEQALSFDTEAEKQFYFPDVTGELSYLKRDQAEEIGGEVVDAKALVRLNWDISLAGGQVARVRKARERHFEGRAQRSEAERQIERDIRIAYSDLQKAHKQNEVHRDRLKVNEDLFRIYTAQFEVARVNLLQLLQSDNALFNAELALMNSEYKMLAAKYAIMASMGRLQEALSVVSVASNESK